MADETIEIEFVGSSKKLVGELDKLVRSNKKLKGSLGDVDTAQKKTEKGSKGLVTSFKENQGVARALGGRYGELAERVGNLGTVFGSAGIAAGAMAAALAITGGAAYKAVSAVFSLVRSLEDLDDIARQLEKGGLGITAADASAIRQANQEVDKLAASFLALKVSVASELAPEMMALTQIMRAMLTVSSSIRGTIPGRLLLAAATGGASETASGLAGSAAENLARGINAPQDAQAIVNASLARREALRGDGGRTGGGRTGGRGSGGAAAASGSDRRSRLIEQALQDAQAMADAEDAAFFARQKAREDAELAAIRAANARKLQAHEDHARAVEDVRRATVGVSMELLAEVGQFAADAFEASAHKSEAHAKRAFAVQKGLDIAKILVSTISASQQALASPPGPPYTIPLAVAVGALGAAAAGRAAAVQPSFHIGSRAGDLAPDEAQATLTRREAVMTPQGMDAIGVANANAGIGGGGEFNVIMQYQHDRVSRKFLSDALRGDARLRRASGRGRVKSGRRRKIIG